MAAATVLVERERDHEAQAGARCPPSASLMRTAERPGLVFCCPSLHIAAESCRSGSHGGRVYRDGETPPPNPDA